MSVFETIKRRRSIGKMTAERPTRQQIEKLLEAATHAPNHHKVEPWKFFVLAGKAREALGAVMAESLAEYGPNILGGRRAIPAMLELFTRFDIHAKLQVPPGTDVERAKKLLEKAESSCLVANSLNSERHLTLEVAIG